MKYDILFWDMDNTLLDFDYSERVSFLKCFEKFKIEFNEEWLIRYSEINKKYWKLFEQGLVTQEEVQKGRFQSLFNEMKYDITWRELKCFIENFQCFLSENYSFIEDSYNLCSELSHSYKQYIITNGICKIQNKKYHVSKLDQIMNGCFVSEQIGFAKPDARFFDYCISKIGCSDRKHILVIGDSFSSDIKGAINSGIDACWFKPIGCDKTDEIVPKYIIHHLNELKSILL